MCAEKCDSMMKDTLKSLCCNNGWCYGVFWGFDHKKTLLLTLKDAYYEQQLGAMIDSMLLQAHVLGGGEIGQVAFTRNHRWIYSDTHHDRRNSLAPFENLEMFQDDSEFYSQFCMGIKTIALISVEPWGVVQFGSTQKNLETKDFVDSVKKLFIGMDVHRQVKPVKNEPLSHSQFLDSPTTQFSSLLSRGMKSGALNSEGLIEANHSLIESPIQIGVQSTNGFEDYLLESSNNLFDCSASPLTSNMSNTRNFTCSIPQTDFKAKTTSGLLTSDGFFLESGFAEPISNPGLEDNDDLSRWFSLQPGPNTTSLTALLTTDLSHSTGLVPFSCLSENNSPVFTNSIQSSTTNTLRSNNHQVKPECNKKPLAWDETLIPVGSSKTRGSNSLFSQLGLDQLLDGTTGAGSCSYAKSGLDDQSSSAAKRRKIDSFPSGYNRVKSEGAFSFDGKMKSFIPVFEPETRNIGLHREPGSCIGDSCILDGANTASSSDRQDEPAKMAKKKAKPGTKPRPKDRQMIQDRLAELRELIPCGEKMSIDRLLERTIRHLNFMQSLTKHAESLKQIDKPKSGEVPKNQSIKGDGGGGVTWACEVGDQSMVCPLIVEDLVTPGQMFIEILCEEKGFFLEIVDIIRGFGLIILKGVMEVREPKKIWAHFLVQAEGTRHVTRHEIFSSLIQLLQMSGQSGATVRDSFGNIISPNAPLFNNCPFPVNLGGALQCGNL